MQEFDVIVVGSGQAGVPLATRMAAAGRRVMLAERSKLGGTCTNYGCTPSKTLIASARAAHVARTAGRLGISVGSVSVDVKAVFDRKDAVVTQWRDGVARRLSAAGERLRLVRAHARFVGERTLEAGGERFRAPIIVLDVGARAAVPPLPGLDRIPWLDNAKALELRTIPRHLIVLGGGYIGCELAQMFRRFGSDVTILERGDHLLSREDPEVSSVIEDVFRAEGIAVRPRTTVSKVAREGDEIIVDVAGEKPLRGSHLLIALGRRPNTDDLGCDAAGIRLDARGNIVADEHFRTSAEGVYAVGDVLGGPQFTHTSWDDHRLLFSHLMGTGPARSRFDRPIPYTVFTDPQVASVGLNEKTARKRGIAYELATFPLASVARAIETDQRPGTHRVLVDPKTETILGASLVGPEAGELLHVFVALMQAKASARAIVDAQAVHPTFAEGVQSSLMTLERFALRP